MTLHFSIQLTKTGQGQFDSQRPAFCQLCYATVLRKKPKDDPGQYTTRTIAENAQ